MRAAVLHGPYDLRIEEVAEPSPKAGEVKVRVAACGICGSDLHLFRGAGLKVRSPLVIGHEFGGTVVETGPHVTNVAVGDAVAVRPLVACGSCAACEVGLANVCVRLRFYGVSPDLPGGMADYVVVAADKIHRLPVELSMGRAALVEPVAVGVHAARRGIEDGGQSAVVLGGGPIGIAIFLSLQALGVSDIFVIEPSPVRRAALSDLGASVVLDPAVGDLRDEIRGLTGGRGADICFDAAGVPQTFTDSQRLAARRGRIVIVAAYEKPVAFDPYFNLSTEQLITAALGYTESDFDLAIEIVAALPERDGWVTDVNLSDTVAAFDLLSDQRAIKILVRPDGSTH